MIKPRKIEHKDGSLSYQLRVFRGKGVKDLSKTVKVPSEMKNAKQIQAWVTRQQVEFEKECSQGYDPGKRWTFTEYADHFMEMKAEALKYRSYRKNLELLERIKPEFGHLRMEDVTPLMLNRFYVKLGKTGQNKQTGGGLSSKTIREYHILIHTIFEQAYKEGVVLNNPADRASPPAVKRKEAESYEPDEIARIIEALEKEPLHWKCITHLLIATGARRGEIMGLKWENVDFEKKTIKICLNLLYHPSRGVYADTPKTGKSRTVTVPDSVLLLLKEQRREQGKLRFQMGMNWTDTGYCFTTETGQPINPDNVTQWLARFGKKIGIPHLHPHGFRHTQASLLIAQGVDVVSVSKRLGHAQTSTTTNIYAHALESADAKVTETITDLFYSNKDKQEQRA